MRFKPTKNFWIILYVIGAIIFGIKTEASPQLNHDFKMESQNQEPVRFVYAAQKVNQRQEVYTQISVEFSKMGEIRIGKDGIPWLKLDNPAVKVHQANTTDKPRYFLNIAINQTANAMGANPSNNQSNGYQQQNTAQQPTQQAPQQSAQANTQQAPPPNPAQQGQQLNMNEVDDLPF